MNSEQLLEAIGEMDFADRQAILFSLGLPNFFWWVPGEKLPNLEVR